MNDTTQTTGTAVTTATGGKGDIWDVKRADSIQPFIPLDFPSVFKFSELIARSNMAPKGMDKPEAVATAIFMGMELGMTPFAALRTIAVINGRPSLYGDGVLGVIRANGLLDDIEETIEGTYPDDNCTATCVVKRKGVDRPVTATFSIADAKRANLFQKVGPWKEYPIRMLKMRARSFALRDMFNDVLGGFYTVEEAQDIDPDAGYMGAAVDNTSPVPPKNTGADAGEQAADVGPKRRGRPAGKRSSVAEEASKGTVVDAEVVTENDPPTPDDDASAKVEPEKPAEQAKSEQEKPKDTPKPKAAPKEPAKPADPPAASPAKKTPGQELSGMIPTWGELGDKIQATLKEMHTAMYQCANMEPDLRGVWSKFFGGFTPSNDPDLKAKQDAAMKQVRNFHKDRIAKAAEPPAEENPPAPEADDPPTPEDEEDVRFDIDGFRRELDGAMSGQTTPAGVNRTYSEFMEGPRRDGLISDDQFEDVFQPLLQEHLLRVDDFDK